MHQMTLDEFVIRSARRTDPPTSARAAEHAHKHAARHREIVLAAHAAHPHGLSDFELATVTGIAQTSSGKRRLELERDGLIEYAGLTRPSPSGSPARVYRITDKGRERAIT